MPRVQGGKRSLKIHICLQAELGTGTGKNHNIFLPHMDYKIPSQIRSASPSAHPHMHLERVLLTIDMLTMFEVVGVGMGGIPA